MICISQQLILSYIRSHEALSDATIARLTRALTPDVHLYNHFSAKLLKRLENMPSEFKDKLYEFRETKGKVRLDIIYWAA